jgi:hypothetical protein
VLGLAAGPVEGDDHPVRDGGRGLGAVVAPVHVEAQVDPRGHAGADPAFRAGFAARGYDEATLAQLPVIDPAATVRTDVAKIIAAPQISPMIRVSGYVYDLKTGLIETVVPPTPVGGR